MPDRTASLQAGHRREGLAHRVGQQTVRPRHHPRRSALIELHLGDAGVAAYQFGKNLDGAGAGTDDRDPLAGQVDAVVPLRGMESGAAEFVHALDVGRPRDVQRTGAGDQKLSDVLVSRLGENVPAVFAVIPVRTAYLLTESDVAA